MVYNSSNRPQSNESSGFFELINPRLRLDRPYHKVLAGPCRALCGTLDGVAEPLERVGGKGPRHRYQRHFGGTFILIMDVWYSVYGYLTE